MSKIELPKAYDAKQVEDRIYQTWEDSGFFAPGAHPPGADKPKAKHFSIAMPPPNATGTLHTGHATMLAIQDLMIRYHRMKGDKTLWLPGTDHASIATQAKVEKILTKEGSSRRQLGREKFLQRINEFVDDSRSTIKNQVKKMGSSCDWSRERFTLDAGLNVAVNTAFEKMYHDGLIVRGDRVVNWCPCCQSTLSDDEVEYKEQQAKFYTFKYNTDFPLTISTTRPETKLGDTAVAVNPKDERYKKYIGQEFTVDFVGVPLKLKIIGDRNVDMEFGTGALGVTPAHSHVDYQMAIANKLPIVKVIGKDGLIESGFGQYSGKSVEEARALVVAELTKQGLLEKEEDISNNLSICYRCGSAIEPLPSLQWFVAVDKPFKLKDKKKLKWKKDEATLKELAIHAVKSGLIKIVPERFEKIYFHWLENLHDWCISRQIWYGHQIPVWYSNNSPLPEGGLRGVGEKIHIGAEKPKTGEWVQDEDTLDTWFSSALWTFSTLGWPEKTDDLKNFHPTSVMETGYDILFFWVARMIIMTAYCLNDIPFETVYLHGLVRDEKGVKMSKSLDNAIDPLDMIEKYGTDALRLSMLIGVTPGNDFKLYDEKIAGYRNFVNKLWNISRFVLTGVEEVKLIEKTPQAKTLADKWILTELNETIKNVNDNLDKYQFSNAGEILQNFTWNDFADWYIEVYKVESKKPAPSEVEGSKDGEAILLYILQNLLKLWHPFCPFITENIWSNFKTDKLLMIEQWPAGVLPLPKESASVGVPLLPEEGRGEVGEFDLIKNIIIAVRNLRSENKIEPKQKINITIIAGDNKDLLDSQAELIKKLKTNIGDLVIIEKGDQPENSVSAIVSGIEIYLDLTGIIDPAAKKDRIGKEIAEAEKYLKTLAAKLANQEFVANAPKAIVEKEQKKLKSQQEKITKLKERLNSLK